MSVILSLQEPFGKSIVFCQRCHAPVGTLTNDEIRQLSIDDVKVLCFDCDPIGVDDIPRQLFCPLERYFIGFGNSVFLAEWVTDDAMPSNKDLRMFRISLTTYFDLITGYGPKYTPLSSSLNLNTKPVKNAVFNGSDRGV